MDESCAATLRGLEGVTSNMGRCCLPEKLTRLLEDLGDGFGGVISVEGDGCWKEASATDEKLGRSSSSGVGSN